MRRGNPEFVKLLVELLTDVIIEFGVHSFPVHRSISKPVTGTTDVSNAQLSVIELLVAVEMDKIGDAGGCGFEGMVDGPPK